MCETRQPFPALQGRNYFFASFISKKLHDVSRALMDAFLVKVLQKNKEKKFEGEGVRGWPTRPGKGKVYAVNWPFSGNV